MQKRQRSKLAFTPEWEGSVKAWAISFLSKNKWRCEAVNDLDDLLQDAYLTFLKISERYPRVIEAPHFMSLYKTAMTNAMWDRARHKQRRAEVNVDLGIDPAEYGLGRIGELTNHGYLNAMLAESEELQFAVKLLQDEGNCVNVWPEEPKRRGAPSKRENLNARLCRLFGFKKVRYDFVGNLKSLLSP